jgi:hypothetical protein
MNEDAPKKGNHKPRKKRLREKKLKRKRERMGGPGEHSRG